MSSAPVPATSPVPPAGATSPAPPVGAAEVFGAAVDAASHYAALLAGPGIERGLIGPREAPRLWERHLLNCAVIADVIPPQAEVADLGSGAGLPGIPLALARPDLAVVLVEPMQRRVQFLQEVVAELELGGRVRVERARAEELRHRVPVVTARALAPWPRLVELSRPLIAPGGRLVAMRGATAADELAASQQMLAAAGLHGEVRACGRGVIDPATTVIVLTHGSGGTP